MKSFATFSLSLLALLPSVLAHGRLAKVAIDGKDYVGPNIGQTVDSVIRMIDKVDPVKDVTGDDISCGQGTASLTATQSAAAKAGSKIDFSWASGDEGTPWPHNV